MEILITNDRIETVGKNLVDLAGELEVTIQKLELIINQLESAWKSDLALDFYKQMREKNIVSLRNLHQHILNQGIYISKVPGAYNSLDETFNNKPIES